MIVSHRKEKAFNAIAYFLEHTSMCYKKKTFKLLWVLDSEHFRHTGRSVTGYKYFAWEMGPVPTELDELIDSDDPELLEYFDITRAGRDRSGFSKIELKNRKPFETKYFSKREMRLLIDIADRFDLNTAEEMEAYTHRKGSPWHRVWEQENRKQEKIPYEYVLDSLSPEEKDTILTIANDRDVFLTNYQ